jgi:hypothetical protein
MAVVQNVCLGYTPAETSFRPPSAEPRAGRRGERVGRARQRRRGQRLRPREAGQDTPGAGLYLRRARDAAGATLCTANVATC